jgi:hypothetical protein
MINAVLYNYHMYLWKSCDESMAEGRISGSNAEEKVTVFLDPTNSANQEAQAKITDAYIDIYLVGCNTYNTCNFEITNDIASGTSALKA